MVLMHGLFDLADDVEETDFRSAFYSFTEHLVAAGMSLGGRFMRHQEHEGYNADAPTTNHYVSVEFADMDQAQRCWDYVETDAEPIKSIHTAVFSKIRNYRFFLSSDV